MPAFFLYLFGHRVSVTERSQSTEVKERKKAVTLRLSLRVPIESLREKSNKQQQFSQNAFLNDSDLIWNISVRKGHSEEQTSLRLRSGNG